MAGLVGEYHTVAFDFRGHGRSEKTELGHTLPQHARDLDAFLDQLGLDDVVLVGWSMGAIVSWEYVDKFGTGRVRAMVDVDMEPSPFRREGYDFGSYDVEDLRDALVGSQTNPLELADQSIAGMLKEPPSRELRNLMFDEGTPDVR